MAVIKYSKQREAIKAFLAGTKEHPTADQVYMHVREEFPNISLGTVYRNLNLLSELGEAVNNVMKKAFPSIVDVNFTATLERLIISDMSTYDILAFSERSSSIFLSISSSPSMFSKNI